MFNEGVWQAQLQQGLLKARCLQGFTHGAAGPAWGVEEQNYPERGKFPPNFQRIRLLWLKDTVDNGSGQSIFAG